MADLKTTFVFAFVISLVFILPSCQRDHGKEEVNKTTEQTSEKRPKTLGENEKKKNEALNLVTYPEKPAFTKKTSQKPLILSYKFVAGQEVHLANTLNMESANFSVNQAGKAIDSSKKYSKIIMTSFADYKVEALKEDGYSIRFHLRRMVLDFQTKNKQVFWDSNDKTQKTKDGKAKAVPKATSKAIPTELKVFETMLKYTYSFTLTQRGMVRELQVLDFKGSPRQKMDIENRMKNILGQVFLILPEQDAQTKSAKAFKLGQSYVGMAQLSPLVPQTSFQLEALSEDERFLLMKPTIKLDKEAIRKSGVHMKKNKVEGWILFDIEKGMKIASGTKSDLEMMMNQLAVSIKSEGQFMVMEKK